MDIQARLSELRAKKTAGSGTVNHLILGFLMGILDEIRPKLTRFGPEAFLDKSGIDNIGPFASLRGPPSLGDPKKHGDIITIQWKSDRNLFVAQYVSTKNAFSVPILKLPLDKAGKMTQEQIADLIVKETPDYK